MDLFYFIPTVSVQQKYDAILSGNHFLTEKVE